MRISTGGLQCRISSASLAAARVPKRVSGSFTPLIALPPARRPHQRALSGAWGGTPPQFHVTLVPVVPLVPVCTLAGSSAVGRDAVIGIDLRDSGFDRGGAVDIGPAGGGAAQPARGEPASVEQPGIVAVAAKRAVEVRFGGAEAALPEADEAAAVERVDIVRLDPERGVAMAPAPAPGPRRPGPGSSTGCSAPRHCPARALGFPKVGLGPVGLPSFDIDARAAGMDGAADRGFDRDRAVEVDQRALPIALPHAGVGAPVISVRVPRKEPDGLRHNSWIARV